MTESATTLMTGHVNVGGFFNMTSASMAPLPESSRRRAPGSPNIDYVTVRGRGYAKAVSESTSMDLLLLLRQSTPARTRSIEVLSETAFAYPRPRTVT